MLYAGQHETLMKSFSLLLQDASHAKEFTGITSFVGEDASGSFGILSSHARMMTSLVMGLSRFRIAKEPWLYIATPGALLYFNNNQLVLSSRHFLVDSDYMRISTALEEQLLAEEALLQSQKQSFRRLEEEALKRLWEVGRSGA